MTKQQRLILWVSILASFVAFLYIAVVNVALPAIQRELGGGLSAQQWIIDAYLIALGSLILIAGSLSDLFGRKKILLAGLIGFAVTSLLCAVAPNATFLVISRFLQGVAGALLVPSSLALIISNFSGTAQGKAIGTWTAWTGISFIVGPLLGGFLVDMASWRLVFAINVIPIALTMWLLFRIKIKELIRESTPVDISGAVLCTLGLGGIVFALIEQPLRGWNDPLIFVPLIAGIISFASFLWYEGRTKYPMLPLDLFKIRNFTVGNIATTVIYAGLTAATFLIIVFVQQVGGYSAFAAGMTLIPVTILLFLLSPKFGELAGKYGPRFFMGVGPIIAGAGFLLMLRVDESVEYWMGLFPGIIVFGLGLSITVAPLTAAILGSVKSDHAGIASAINNAVARVAGLLAIAAIGAIVAAQFSTVLDQKVAAGATGNASQQVIDKAKTVPLRVQAPQEFTGDKDALQAALKDASISAFRTGTAVMALLVITGGVVSGIGIQNRAKVDE